MRLSTLSVLIGSTVLTGGCASSHLNFRAAPQIDLPADARRPCSLTVLPAEPTEADLEATLAARGAQIVTCEAARSLAVDIHDAEHRLEAQLTGKARPWWRIW